MLAKLVLFQMAVGKLQPQNKIGKQFDTRIRLMDGAGTSSLDFHEVGRRIVTDLLSRLKAGRRKAVDENGVNFGCGKTKESKGENHEKPVDSLMDS